CGWVLTGALRRRMFPSSIDGSAMNWARRLAYWLRFRSHERDLRDELASHRELLASDLERGGLTPNAAAHAARSAMGNETYMREEARGVWLSPRLEALL